MVAKLVSVKTMMVIASTKRWELHQMDVHNAFPQRDLDEEIFMKPPKALLPSHDKHVCRLRKSLYGLKQASCNWFMKLHSKLLVMGLSNPLLITRYLHILSMEKSLTYLLVYVDDIILSSNDNDSICQLKENLSMTFHIKDLGKLKFF